MATRVLVRRRRRRNVLGAASLLGAITVLEKPFDVAEVLAAVELVLESDEPA